MIYDFTTSKKFDKEFSKLDKYTQKFIKGWIEKNLIDSPEPRSHGRGLTGNYEGEWRYRVGNYRLICLIEDNELVITGLSVGHRKNVYKKK